MQVHELKELVVAHVDDLTRLVERRANRLLRYESVEDLHSGKRTRHNDLPA